MKSVALSTAVLLLLAVSSAANRSFVLDFLPSNLANVDANCTYIYHHNHQYYSKDCKNLTLDTNFNQQGQAGTDLDHYVGFINTKSINVSYVAKISNNNKRYATILPSKTGLKAFKVVQPISNIIQPISIILADWNSNILFHAVFPSHEQSFQILLLQNNIYVLSYSSERECNITIETDFEQCAFGSLLNGCVVSNSEAAKSNLRLLVETNLAPAHVVAQTQPKNPSVQTKSSVVQTASSAVSTKLRKVAEKATATKGQDGLILPGYQQISIPSWRFSAFYMEQLNKGDKLSFQAIIDKSVCPCRIRVIDEKGLDVGDSIVFTSETTHLLITAPNNGLFYLMGSTTIAPRLASIKIFVNGIPSSELITAMIPDERARTQFTMYFEVDKNKSPTIVVPLPNKAGFICMLSNHLGQPMKVTLEPYSTKTKIIGPVFEESGIVMLSLSLQEKGCTVFSNSCKMTLYLGKGLRPCDTGFAIDIDAGCHPLKKTRPNFQASTTIKLDHKLNHHALQMGLEQSDVITFTRLLPSSTNKIGITVNGAKQFSATKTMAIKELWEITIPYSGLFQVFLSGTEVPHIEALDIKVNGIRKYQWIAAPEYAESTNSLIFEVPKSDNVIFRMASPQSEHKLIIENQNGEVMSGRMLPEQNEQLIGYQLDAGIYLAKVQSPNCQKDCGITLQANTNLVLCNQASVQITSPCIKQLQERPLPSDGRLLINKEEFDKSIQLDLQKGSVVSVRLTSNLQERITMVLEKKDGTKVKSEQLYSSRTVLMQAVPSKGTYKLNFQVSNEYPIPIIVQIHINDRWACTHKLVLKNQTLKSTNYIMFTVPNDIIFDFGISCLQPKTQIKLSLSDQNFKYLGKVEGNLGQSHTPLKAGKHYFTINWLNGCSDACQCQILIGSGAKWCDDESSLANSNCVVTYIPALTGVQLQSTSFQMGDVYTIPLQPSDTVKVALKSLKGSQSVDIVMTNEIIKFKTLFHFSNLDQQTLPKVTSGGTYKLTFISAQSIPAKGIVQVTLNNKTKTEFVVVFSPAKELSKGMTLQVAPAKNGRSTFYVRTQIKPVSLSAAILPKAFNSLDLISPKNNKIRLTLYTENGVLVTQKIISSNNQTMALLVRPGIYLFVLTELSGCPKFACEPSFDFGAQISMCGFGYNYKSPQGLCIKMSFLRQQMGVLIGLMAGMVALIIGSYCFFRHRNSGSSSLKDIPPGSAVQEKSGCFQRIKAFFEGKQDQVGETPKEAHNNSTKDQALKEKKQDVPITGVATLRISKPQLLNTVENKVKLEQADSERNLKRYDTSEPTG